MRSYNTIDDDGNLVDGVKLEDEDHNLPPAENEQPEEQPEEGSDEEQPEADVEEQPENLSTAKLVVEELSRARPSISFASNAAGGFHRLIPVRYAINDNPTRGSRNLPEPKHLVIKLPDDLARLFAGVWVAEDEDWVFIDFFARNDQNDRGGHKVDDAWRWMKIKASAEIAMGISRPYTKSRCDGELVRDYKVGAFKIYVPREETPERTAEGHHRPMFS